MPKYSEEKLSQCHIFHHTSNKYRFVPICVSRLSIPLSLKFGYSSVIMQETARGLYSEFMNLVLLRYFAVLLFVK